MDLIPPDPSQPAIEPEKVKPLKNLTIIDLEGEPPPDEPLDEPEPGKSRFRGEPGAARPSRPRGPSAGAGPARGPALVSRVEPVYPDLARRAGIEGTVELEVSIDPTGQVTDVEVVRGLPLGMSEAAADARCTSGSTSRRGPRPARSRRASPCASVSC